MGSYEELYSLSPNQELFAALQIGQELSTTAAQDTANETSTFPRIRNAILESLRKNDPASINELSAALGDDNKRLELCGEVLLAWSAAAKNNNEKYAKILRSAAKLILNLNPSQPTHVRALREWLCILLDLVSSGTGQRPSDLSPEQWLNLNYARAGRTNQCRPGLVGESFYMLGRVAEEVGDTAKRNQCFECVIKDLGRNLLRDDLPKNLRFEAYGIWYWYQKACTHLHELEPSLKQQTQSDRDTIQRKYGGVSFEPVGPAMLGPIAKTYLSRKEYLKRVLREIRVARQSGGDSELAAVCYKYDYCHEIDTYLFALERHEMVLPIVGGLVRLEYEPDVQEALGALKELDSEESS